MENIALVVNLEGMSEKVTTDWNAVSATLLKRQVSQHAMVNIYADLCAGLRVTTRGLTLAKHNEELLLDGIVSYSARAQSAAVYNY